MKFKTRLVVAFFTIILIPLVLSSALVCMVGKYQLSSIEKNYGIKNTTVESLASSVTVLTRLTEQPYRELEALIRENPEEMEDAAQLESLNGELQDKKSYLLVRKNDTIAYIGTEASKAEKVISQLPEYGAAETTSENGMYLGGKAQVLLKQIDFQYSDGSEGSAFRKPDSGSEKSVRGDYRMHFPGTCIYRMCADHLDLQKCHGTGREDAGGNKEYKRRKS